jgi:hypothetical protein
MTPAALTSYGLSIGVTLSVAPSGRLKVSYEDEPALDDFVEALKASKPAVIAHLEGRADDTEMRLAAQAPAVGQQSELPSFVQPVMSVDIGTTSRRRHAARKKATSAPTLAGERSGEGIVARAMRNQRQATREAAWWREAKQ